MKSEEIYNTAINNFQRGNYKVFDPRTKTVDKGAQLKLNEEDSKEAALDFLLYLYLYSENREGKKGEWRGGKICIPKTKIDTKVIDFNEFINFISSKTKISIGERIEIIREGRKKQTAEIFTPDKLVNEMLDKLPKEVWIENKTFCDPACGNGNFLVHVAIRKIWKGHNTIDVLHSIYGVDIMRNNVKECRLRLLKTISLFDIVTEEHIKAVLQNIVQHDALTYNFEFDNIPNSRTIKRWVNYASEERILDLITIMNDSIPQLRRKK